MNNELRRGKVIGDNERWFEFEFESKLGRGKGNEFKLKVNWEEGKLMNLN